MSPSTRDRFLLACAGGLFLAGLLAWWLSPSGGTQVGLGIGSLLAIWLSAAGLAAAVWHLGQQPASRESYVASLALAATAPLSAVPLLAWPGPLVVGAGLTLAALASLPLGVALSRRIGEAGLSKRVAWVVATCVLGAVVVGWITAGTTATDLAAQAMDRASIGRPSAGLALRSALLTFALALPAGIAAWWVLREAEAGMSAQSRILVALGLAAAGAVPVVTGIALLTPVWQVFAVPLFAAAAMAVILARFAIGPLARAAGSAMVQRDLVVAASESERARLASALHDGPLGDVTLLVQRLDQAGDVDNAAIARSIATDLRSIGNELQLPILEDLGAGPALEWLVNRLSHRSGAEVGLELQTGARPPAQVELAVYRIAQEALLNALKHGRAPFTVRYAARPDLVSLSVHDAGPGLDRAAPARAQREGRLGLLSMAQRAESIGARLVMAAPPSGGTHVELEWTPAPG
ncbi:MAG: hypothetical protein M3395_08720 [Chloroflexota bacterium]|nr:hypothetical protein [Chloroflexota bacterium]